jgi:RHS repeat-associated protein
VSQYDDAGRCVAKASLGTAGLWRRRFWRSGEGDLLQRDDDRRGTTRFRYDAAHRLDGVQKPDGTVDVYAHDAAGNLLQKPGLSEGYVAGVQAGPAAVAFDTSHVALSRGNKLYRANGDRFHYDARDHVVGREGSWGRVTYVRDGLGRLRRIDWAPPGAAGSTAAGPDGSRTATTWEAEYDALGRRTKKVVHRADANGAPIRDEWRFVWDRDRLAAEVLPDGRLRLYVYPDAVALVPMLAVEYASTTSDPRQGRVYSFHTDHRGAVERVEDAAGNVVWEAELGPYGEANVLVGADFHQPFRLVGQYYDAETGLCAHRYRMYSPELGRFLESDPIGLQGGLNVYAWPGCPLVVTDPLGLGCPHAESGDSPSPRREDAADGEAEPSAAQRRAAEAGLEHRDDRATPSPELRERITTARRKATEAEARQARRRDGKTIAVNGGTHLSGYNTASAPRPPREFTNGPGRDPVAARMTFPTRG